MIKYIQSEIIKKDSIDVAFQKRATIYKKEKGKLEDTL